MPGKSVWPGALRRVLDTGRVAATGLACTWYPGSGAAERFRAVLEPLRQAGG
jgi:arginase